jgi:hypothetical protein
LVSPALSTNIRTGWKDKASKNTLAYFAAASMTLKTAVL